MKQISETGVFLVAQGSDALVTQLTSACSKLTIEKLEKGAKCVQR